jgi:hypothetical protein
MVSILVKAILNIEAPENCNSPLEIEVHPGATNAEVNMKVDVNYELMTTVIEKIQSGEAVVQVMNVPERAKIDIEGELDWFDKTTEVGADTRREIGVWYSKAIERTDGKKGGREGIFGEWLPFRIGSEAFVLLNSFVNGSQIGKVVIKAIHINKNGLFMRVVNTLETAYYSYTDIGKVLFVSYADAQRALNMEEELKILIRMNMI